MRRFLFGSLLLSLFCPAGCGVEEGHEEPTSSSSPSSETTIRVEATDEDGDGKPDLWRREQLDGTVVELRDTNGDGEADQERRFEPLTDLPPGLKVSPRLRASGE